MIYQTGVVKKFVLCLFLCLAGGWLTGLITQQGVKEWYPQLLKPYGTPPDVVFPIVWTILYIFMAVALTLVWTSTTEQKTKAVLVFVAQLFLNFIWSWLFFCFQSPGSAFIDIVLLWVFLIVTIKLFWNHSHLAAYLLLPYLAWVTYACYLNLFIWLHN